RRWLGRPSASRLYPLYLQFRRCLSVEARLFAPKEHRCRSFVGDAPDAAFIGCNVNLIAPIRIEDDSFIAAGSTLTQNVPEGSLAIARAYQVNKPNYMMERNGKSKSDKKSE
ncbi:MAG TPA: hypothetical protein PLZ76_05030, partial [Bacillota bacterium]|nr:hypothetical protein [Bacillota bacterium]